MFSGINNIEFDMTNTCNLDCIYCYIKDHSENKKKHLRKVVFDTFFEVFNLFCLFQTFVSDFQPFVELYAHSLPE